MDRGDVQAGDTVALLLSYDGGALAGWQLQPHVETVQGVVERALGTLHGLAPGRRGVTVVGAGRTDAGVHALGQVAAYRAPGRRGIDELEAGLNGLLPATVRALGVARAPADFHPCRSAVGKTYRYRIVNRRVILPFESPWAWHVRAPLDLDRMRCAARHLQGRHDFASFATSGGQSETTVRHLRRLEVDRADGDTILIEAEADGFLYRMVRNLAGLLMEVGCARREPESVGDVLRARRRSAAGRTAPAHGLCLVRVAYPEGGPFFPGATDLEAPRGE